MSTALASASTSGPAQTPGSMTSRAPSFSSRTHAWPNFVSSMRRAYRSAGGQAAQEFLHDPPGVLHIGMCLSVHAGQHGAIEQERCRVDIGVLTQLTGRDAAPQ